MISKNRLSAPLTEALVLGALTHNLAWMEGQEISLKQHDFFLKDNQVLYSIMRDRFLERNEEVTAEQLAIEAGKHPVKNQITIENCRSLRDKLGVGISFETFQKESLRLNKLKVLRELTDYGIDVESLIGEESVIAPSITDIIDSFTIDQILNHFRIKVDNVETSLGVVKHKASITAATDLREMIKEMQQTPQVGALLDGDIFNSVARGALLGKYYLNSAPSGVGKTRMMLGNAALLAYPRVMNDGTIRHRKEGYYPVLFVTTELTPQEVQSMLVSSIANVEEEDVKTGNLTFEEMNRLEVAIQLIEASDHFFIEQIPDPSIAEVKSKVESHIRKNGTEYIFFDYIFMSGALAGENSRSRDDVALMNLSILLKNIAAINNVFVMSGTQLNGSWESDSPRNQNMIRGGKAIADKIDVGMITLDLDEEERVKIIPIIEELQIGEPNIVTDVYKNRGGRYVLVKIFRRFNKGTCRMEDLFMTTTNYNVVVPLKVYKEETQSIKVTEWKGENIYELNGN